VQGLLETALETAMVEEAKEAVLSVQPQMGMRR
jgi:hypothetical protein